MDAGVGLVLGGFVRVVEQFGWKLILRSTHNIMNFIRQLKPFEFLNALTQDPKADKSKDPEPPDSKTIKAPSQEQPTSPSLA